MAQDTFSPQPRSQEDFSHFHNDYVRDIKETVGEVVASAQTADEKAVAEYFQSFFGTDFDTYMAPKRQSPDPEAVLREGVAKLGDVDKLNLILSNLLEGLKRGDSLGKMLERLSQLGLFPQRRIPKKNEPTDEKPPPVKEQSGNFLYNALGGAKKVALSLMHIVKNALLAIPRFVKFSPQVHIGLVMGVLPTISFGFKVEPDGISLHELYEVLRKGVGGSPVAQ
jgi:hypothetical protein